MLLHIVIKSVEEFVEMPWDIISIIKINISQLKKDIL